MLPVIYHRAVKMKLFVYGLVFKERNKTLDLNSAQESVGILCIFELLKWKVYETTLSEHYKGREDIPGFKQKQQLNRVICKPNF